MSSAWIEMKVKETLHYSYTLRNKIVSMILLIIAASLDIVFNKCSPIVIVIPTTSSIIVYVNIIT
jgi:hypothetical protein